MKSVVFTIHGTFVKSTDYEDCEDGENLWWTRNGLLAKALGTKFTIIPLTWNGENTESSRLFASESHKMAILKHSAGAEEVHFVAHSHGGNVLVRALGLAVSEDRKLAGKIRSASFVGVPFIELKSELSASGLALGLFVSLVISFFLSIFAAYLSSFVPKEWWIAICFVFPLLMFITSYFLESKLESRIDWNALCDALKGRLFIWSHGKDEAIALCESLTNVRQPDVALEWLAAPVWLTRRKATLAAICKAALWPINQVLNRIFRSLSLSAARANLLGDDLIAYRINKISRGCVGRLSEVIFKIPQPVEDDIESLAASKRRLDKVLRATLNDGKFAQVLGLTDYLIHCRYFDSMKFLQLISDAINGNVSSPPVAERVNSSRGLSYNGVAINRRFSAVKEFAESAAGVVSGFASSFFEIMAGIFVIGIFVAGFGFGAGFLWDQAGEGRAAPDSREAAKTLSVQDVNSAAKSGSVSAAEGAVPSKEEVVPAKEGAVPAHEKVAPAEEEAVPATEKVAPTEEEAVPATEKVAPAEEEAVPATEKVAPAEEEAVPATEKVAPAEEEAVPATEKVAPAEEEAVPATEKVAPAEEGAVPATEKVAPAEEGAVLAVSF